MCKHRRHGFVPEHFEYLQFRSIPEPSRKTYRQLENLASQASPHRPHPCNFSTVCIRLRPSTCPCRRLVCIVLKGEAHDVERPLLALANEVGHVSRVLGTNRTKMSIEVTMDNGRDWSGKKKGGGTNFAFLSRSARRLFSLLFLFDARSTENMHAVFPFSEVTNGFDQLGLHRLNSQRIPFPSSDAPSFPVVVGISVKIIQCCDVERSMMKQFALKTCPGQLVSAKKQAPNNHIYITQ
jgi:hypothetical protein